MKLRTFITAVVGVDFVTPCWVSQKLLTETETTQLIKTWFKPTVKGFTILIPPD